MDDLRNLIARIETATPDELPALVARALRVLAGVEEDKTKFGIPLYVMNAWPHEWPGHPEWQRAGAVGVHMRVLPGQIEKIPGELDQAARLGIRVGLVVAVHSAKTGPHTTYTKFVPGIGRIPDYWSEAFFQEWLRIRRTVAMAVADHPALAWVGHDFGLDDESWPAKPWWVVRVARLDIWGYMMQYVRAAHALARLYQNVPVLAQCYTMYSRQGLDVLYTEAPPNLGIKLNGLKTEPLPLPDEKVRPYWERCGREGRTRGLEPGIVPTGTVEELRATALTLVRRARDEWKADFLNMQRKFIEALATVEE